MITEAELREVMERMGYSPEEIDTTCKKYGFLNLINDTYMEMVEAMRRAFEGIVGLLEECDCDIEPPKKEKRRRPPRCVGPKNKTPQRVPLPARVARSDCRKFKKEVRT